MKKVFFSLLLVLPIITKAQIISTIAGNGTTGYTGDLGPGTAATIHNPNQVAVDHSGNVYIDDECNNVIRKVSATGEITTCAGNGGEAGSCGGGDFTGDGGAAISASFRSPFAVTVDASGNIYIGDDNDEVRIVNTSGIINAFAGQGPDLTTTDAAFNGEGGPATAAFVIYPLGLATGNAGDIFFIDGSNGQVRKVSASGIITTVAGNGVCCGGYTGDNGPATTAQLNNANQIAVDNSGNLYIADEGNFVIRKVNGSGIITTFAGNGSVGYTGDGGAATAAKLWSPSGVATDAAGNVYIADKASNCIREVNVSTGIISTIAGGGMGPGSGDGGPATAATLSSPTCVAVDASGNIYITDLDNQRIRKVTVSSSSSSIGNVNEKPGDLKIFPSPATSILTITSTDKIKQVTVSGLLGQVVASSTPSTGEESLCIDISALPAGIYFVKVNGNEVRKFVKE